MQEMSPHELQVERAQMQAILEEFPTTLAQDRELLTSLQTAGDECYLNLKHYYFTDTKLHDNRILTQQQYFG